MNMILLLTSATVVLAALSMRTCKQVSGDAKRDAVHWETLDELTGLPNRIGLDQELRRVRTSSAQVGLAKIDLDGFGDVNNMCGRARGDAVLEAVGQTIATYVRDSDVVYRSGGQQFVVLLPGASAGDAEAVIDRVRAQVAALTFADLPQGLTMSAGVAESTGARVDDSVHEATAALRRAKDAGRNRVGR